MISPTSRLTNRSNLNIVSLLNQKKTVNNICIPFKLGLKNNFFFFVFEK